MSEEEQYLALSGLKGVAQLVSLDPLNPATLSATVHSKSLSFCLYYAMQLTLSLAQTVYLRGFVKEGIIFSHRTTLPTTVSYTLSLPEPEHAR